MLRKGTRGPEAEAANAQVTSSRFFFPVLSSPVLTLQLFVVIFSALIFSFQFPLASWLTEVVSSLIRRLQKLLQGRNAFLE